MQPTKPSFASTVLQAAANHVLAIGARKTRASPITNHLSPIPSQPTYATDFVSLSPAKTSYLCNATNVPTQQYAVSALTVILMTAQRECVSVHAERKPAQAEATRANVPHAVWSGQGFIVEHLSQWPHPTCAGRTLANRLECQGLPGHYAP